jgi:hypothetical protein
MPTHQAFTPEKVAAIKADIALGLTHKAIGARHQIHPSSVSKINRGIIGKRALPPAVPASSMLRPRGGSKYTGLVPQIHALREQKYSVKEISQKLNIPTGAVNYHLYKRPNTSSSEGALPNGHINKHVATGIAYAETERFVAVLAQRLGVPADFLRSRLSELLGRSPIRGASGPAN